MCSIGSLSRRRPHSARGRAGRKRAAPYRRETALGRAPRRRDRHFATALRARVIAAVGGAQTPILRAATISAVAEFWRWKGAASRAAWMLGVPAGRKAVLSFLAALPSEGRKKIARRSARPRPARPGSGTDDEPPEPAKKRRGLTGLPSGLVCLDRRGGDHGHLAPAPAPPGRSSKIVKKGTRDQRRDRRGIRPRRDLAGLARARGG